MDTVNVRYFNWQCRTCLRELVETTNTNEDQQRQWEPIFGLAEVCSGAESIADLLSNTIPQIEVKIEDNLSKKICQACLKQLTSMHSFQQKCIQSDREMREMIAIINATEILVEEQELHLPKEQQQQTNIPDPLQNVDKAIETCGNAFEDVNNLVKNEPCDDNDEFIAIDNHKGTLLSTINVDVNDTFISIDKHEDTLFSTINVDDNDKFIAVDNHKDTLISTINVEKDVVCSNDSRTCEPDRPELISGHAQSPPLYSSDSTESEEELFKATMPGSPTHVCILCKKEFKKSFLLTRHMRRHDRREKKNRTPQLPKREPKLKPCNVCEKMFTSYRKLRVHKKEEHPTEIEVITAKREYSCEICNKICATSSALKMHIPTHSRGPLVCSECGKSFSARSHLRAHRVRHSEVKPIDCPLCPAKFHFKGDMEKHKLVHDGIKRFMCDVCGQAFLWSKELTAHKKYHTGVKPFKCDYCEMRFVRGYSKQRHMVKHTGEKPYKCQYCERAFGQSNDCVKHLRVHLGENIYWCTLCPSDFRSASEKRAHFATHKNDDEETRERNMKALKDKEVKLQLKFSKNKAQQPLVKDSKQKVDPETRK